MAEDKPKKRRLKQSVSVRERAEQATSAEPKTRRLSTTAKKVNKPLKTVSDFGKKEYYLPMPDNKVGRFLNKRRYVIPRFFKDAWAELRQVTWPGRRETMRLTLAVFMFAFIFGTLVAIVDYGLDKVFRSILLK
jgi:preprotein translocase SecE subunit